MSIRSNPKPTKLVELLEERKRFPVGMRNKPELDYVRHRLAAKNAGTFKLLIVPTGILTMPKEDELRREMFNKRYLAALIDLSTIWKPYTSVHFSLVVLSDEKPEKVLFAQYLADDTFTSKGRSNNHGLIGEQEMSKPYSEYVRAIESFLSSKTTFRQSKYWRTWSTPFSEVDTEHLNHQYHDPELVEMEENLKKERTKPIEECAEIVKPRKIKGSGLMVKTKHFAYPFPMNSLPQEEKTTVLVRKGDILLSESFHGSQKMHFVHEEPSKPCYASTFLTVIRPKGSSVVTPEYLFLYLQSETVKKYFLRHQTGTFFPRLSIKVLRQMPVIVPSQVTQQNSRKIFETLFLSKQENIIDQINDALFKGKLPTAPIQKEFVQEFLSEMRVKKREVVDKIIEGDLKELDLCLQNDMYKSFVILAGSVLEAFLLDWVSEMEGKDYFHSSEEYTLGKLIWEKLKKVHLQTVGQDVVDKADSIRATRNLIHPKVYFHQSAVDGNLCNQVLNDLRFIIRSRH